MVLSGESIDAERAQQAGLVSDIHPANLSDEYALKLAATIARHSPLALRAANSLHALRKKWVSRPVWCRNVSCLRC